MDVNQKQLNDLINITHRFSKDLHIRKFGTDKYNVLIIIKAKTVGGDIALLNGLIIKTMEDVETYKYLEYQQGRLLEDRQVKEKISKTLLKAYQRSIEDRTERK